MDSTLTLAWIRREMRLHDNRVLAGALSLEGEVQPVFIFDTEILARFDNKRDKRLTFIAETLHNMHAELKKRGGGMLVLYGKASDMMPKLCKALGATTLIAAPDVEPDTRKRDREVFTAISGFCEMKAIEDHLGLFPNRVMKNDGKPYTVFTPYSKKWLETLTPKDTAEARTEDKGRYAEITKLIRKASDAGLDVVTMTSVAETLKHIGYEKADLGEWTTHDAQKKLSHFAKTHVADYKEMRNFPAEPGTSKLSPYLRFGLISIRECIRAAYELPKSETWIKELIWRDFYAMILYHFPDVVTQDFQQKYRGKLNWNQSKNDFQRWCDGMTGYPFIDAAMRQLKQTGWMHNRARMVVASFLTKDLGIDWRLGEEHFAQYLMDYELASNNGGWQWSASTGTDAQPWFRIFNPVTQSETYDPQGEYIRAFVPELKKLSNKEIHAPWKAKVKLDYPDPIVDHGKAREKTLAMFKAVV